MRGLEAVRVNAVPMVVLWTLAVTTVLAYYLVPGVASAFEPLMRWQTQNGELAAFLNRVFFCGLLPGVFLLTVRSIRPPRLFLTVLVYSLWGGLWGIVCDGFFSLQAFLFGHGTDVVTLVEKTLVDQFVWTVAVCTPVNALFFPWVARDFRFGPRINWRKFLCEDCLSLLVTNWIVWIPVTAVVYAFPLPLQIQLVGFACSFWMLAALRAAAKGGKP